MTFADNVALDIHVANSMRGQTFEYHLDMFKKQTKKPCLLQIKNKQFFQFSTINNITNFNPIYNVAHLLTTPNFMFLLLSIDMIWVPKVRPPRNEYM